MSLHHHKKRRNRVHAQRRAFERLEIIFTNQDITDISNICKKGKEIYSFKNRTLTRSKKLIEFKNKKFIVIYSKVTHNIVTILTLDMLNREEKNEIAFLNLT